MASPISPISANSTTPTPSQPAAAPDTSTQLVQESVFLKLLISQLKNQDPLNPSDPMQFVTQLAQFSQLETLFGIRGDLQAVLGTNTPPPAGSSNP
jgi:flagellar basal-body rod modification protein FlgD